MDELAVTDWIYYKKFTDLQFTEKIDKRPHQHAIKNGKFERPWVMKNSINGSEYILCTEDVQKICDLNYLGKTQSRIEDCENLGKVPVSGFEPNSKLLEFRQA